MNKVTIVSYKFRQFYIDIKNYGTINHTLVSLLLFDR